MRALSAPHGGPPTLSSGSQPRPALRQRAPARHVPCAGKQQGGAKAEAKAESSEEEDDPSKYPERTPFTGGWAGGELGLRKFIEDGAKLDASNGTAAPKKGKGKGKGAAQGEGEEGGEEMAPSSFPGKEDIMGLPVTGGFAGGERGLQEFVSTGKLNIADQPQRNQFSALSVAFLVAGFGVVGGLLLEDAVEIVETWVKAGLPGPKSGFTLDPGTKLALQAALALLALTGTGVGIRAIVKQVRDGSDKLASQAVNFGKVALFWVSVFAAIKFVLENS